jgi:hypothetical protein
VRLLGISEGDVGSEANHAQTRGDALSQTWMNCMDSGKERQRCAVDQLSRAAPVVSQTIESVLTAGTLVEQVRLVFYETEDARLDSEGRREFATSTRPQGT